MRGGEERGEKGRTGEDSLLAAEVEVFGLERPEGGPLLGSMLGAEAQRA